MTKFRKYAKSAWCIETTVDHVHGDKVTVTTRHGKEVDVKIWKLIFEKDGVKYYSYIRDDGRCAKEKHLRNAERYANRANKKRDQSNDYYERSRKDSDFLSLGEPIKVGHHSEKRHRRMVEQARSNATKSVAALKESENLAEKAEGAQYAADSKIYLDTPDCLEALSNKLSQLEAEREAIKAHNKTSSEKAPGYLLPNLGAQIRTTKANLKIAVAMWQLEPVTTSAEAVQ